MKRRFLSAVMVMMILLSILPGNVLATTEEQPDKTTDSKTEPTWEEYLASAETEGDAVGIMDVGIQSTEFTEKGIYTVLAIDTSGSMSGTPMSVAKKSAIKFCDSLLKAAGNNHIALITLNSSSSLVYDFTDDITVLSSKINSLRASGGTNTNHALLYAKELLDRVTAQSVKNIVIFSDGLPQSGPISSIGPYTYSNNSSYYRYANTAYNTAQSLKQTHNIYTLGFFHDLSGKDLTFGKRFMEDLHNASYFNVTSADDLDFSFDGIADGILGAEVPVKSTESDKVLEESGIEDLQLLENIQINNDPIYGPSITILKNTWFEKTFYLFELDGEAKLDLGKLSISPKVDLSDKTIKILVGYDVIDESMSTGTDYTGRGEWTKAYTDMKSLYKALNGKEVTNYKSAMKKFGSLYNGLKANELNLFLNIKGTCAGYMEFSYESGRPVLSEGGFIIKASTGGSIECPLFWCVYSTVGLTLDAEGNINVAFDGWKKPLAINSHLGFCPALNVGIGAGTKKGVDLYVEGGAKGSLPIDIFAVTGKFKENITDFVPLSVRMTASLYAEAKAGPFKGEISKEFASQQLLPRTDTLSIMSTEDIDVDDLKIIPRDYLTTGSINIMEIDDTASFEKTSLYPYNEPNLIEFNNGNRLLLWTDDDGEKADADRTSMYYSVYDSTNGSWIPYNTIHDNAGYNATPVIYNNGEMAYMFWQRSDTVLGDTCTFEDWAKSINLYMSIFDGKDFCEPICVTGTDNEAYERLHSISEKDGTIEMVWMENSENDIFSTSGTNVVYKCTYTNGVLGDTEIIVETDLSIEDIESVGNGTVIYSLYDDSTETTDVYVNCNGKESTIAQDITDSFMTQVVGNKLYYLLSEELYNYDIENNVITNENFSGLTNFTVLENDENKILLTLITNDFTSELYQSVYKNGEWGNLTQLTDYGKYIRDYSPILKNNGKLAIALNLVDVDTSDGENGIYKTATLKVVEELEHFDLIVDDVMYYTDDLIAGNEIELKFDVINNSQEDVNNINSSLSDKNGNVIAEKTISENIAPGEMKTLSVLYKVPDILDNEVLKVSLSTEKKESDIGNNFATVNIGKADLEISNCTLETEIGKAQIVTEINNIGFTDAKNVTVDVYNSNISDELLDTIDIGTVVAGESTSITFELPEEYHMLIDDKKLYGIYFDVKTDCEEEKYDNNGKKFVFDDLAEEVSIIVPEVIQDSENSNIVTLKTNNTTAVNNVYLANMGNVNYTYTNYTQFIADGKSATDKNGEKLNPVCGFEKFTDLTDGEQLMLGTAGNYTIFIKYVDYKGNTQYSIKNIKVEEDNSPKLNIDDSGIRVGIDKNNSSKINSCYIMNIGKETTYNYTNWNNFVSYGKANGLNGNSGYLTVNDTPVMVNGIGNYIGIIKYTDIFGKEHTIQKQVLVDTIKPVLLIDGNILTIRHATVSSIASMYILNIGDKTECSYSSAAQMAIDGRANGLNPVSGMESITNPPDGLQLELGKAGNYVALINYYETPTSTKTKRMQYDVFNVASDADLPYMQQAVTGSNAVTVNVGNAKKVSPAWIMAIGDETAYTYTNWNDFISYGKSNGLNPDAGYSVTVGYRFEADHTGNHVAIINYVDRVGYSHRIQDMFNVNYIQKAPTVTLEGNVLTLHQNDAATVSAAYAMNIGEETEYTYSSWSNYISTGKSNGLNPLAGCEVFANEYDGAQLTLSKAGNYVVVMRYTLDNGHTYVAQHPEIITVENDCMPTLSVNNKTFTLNSGDFTVTNVYLMNSGQNGDFTYKTFDNYSAFGKSNSYGKYNPGRGYSYFTNMADGATIDIEHSGYYNVLIKCTDSAGNTRTLFQKYYVTIPPSVTQITEGGNVVKIEVNGVSSIASVYILNIGNETEYTYKSASQMKADGLVNGLNPASGIEAISNPANGLKLELGKAGNYVAVINYYETASSTRTKKIQQDIFTVTNDADLPSIQQACDGSNAVAVYVGSAKKVSPAWIMAIGDKTTYAYTNWNNFVSYGKSNGLNPDAGYSTAVGYRFEADLIGNYVGIIDYTDQVGYTHRIQDMFSVNYIQNIPTVTANDNVLTLHQNDAVKVSAAYAMNIGEETEYTYTSWSNYLSTGKSNGLNTLAGCEIFSNKDDGAQLTLSKAGNYVVVIRYVLDNGHTYVAQHPEIITVENDYMPTLSVNNKTLTLNSEEFTVTNVYFMNSGQNGDFTYKTFDNYAAFGKSKSYGKYNSSRGYSYFTSLEDGATVDVSYSGYYNILIKCADSAGNTKTLLQKYYVE